jgi:hypothetical protein
VSRRGRTDEGCRNGIGARELAYRSKQTKEGGEVGFVKGRPYRRGRKSRSGQKFGSLGQGCVIATGARAKADANADANNDLTIMGLVGLADC